MSITASGLFVTNWIAKVNATQLGINLSSTTNKIALFQPTLANPNFSTDTAYGVAPYNANEVASGFGYNTGGVTVTSPAVSEAPAGTLAFTLANTSWSASTITNAHAALFYADALSPKAAICLINFGADYSTTNGTFTIQWANTGMFTIKLS